ncbi:deoxynucleotide monophosphate kinase family protein [Kribbella sp. WER1]
MLIGLIGKKQSGKDTFARALAKYDVHRFAFADPLREALLGFDPNIVINQDEYGWFLDENWCLPYGAPFTLRLSHLVSAMGWDGAKNLREVRRAMQNFGVGIRELDPDFWLNITATKVYQARFAEGKDVVITDVRFENEAEWVKEAGGILVRITRPGLVSDDTHESETALDNHNTDFHVTNTSLEDLDTWASRIVTHHHA